MRAPRHPGADDAMIMQVSAHESQTAAGVEPGGWREDGARMAATQDTDLEGGAPHVGFRPLRSNDSDDLTRGIAPLTKSVNHKRAQRQSPKKHSKGGGTQIDNSRLQSANQRYGAAVPAHADSGENDAGNGTEHWSGPLEYIPRYPLFVLGGMSKEERQALDGADAYHAERVYVCMSWVQRAVVERIRKGGLDVGEPLRAMGLARFSAGMDAFMQCKKIVDTPFPFPYAQCTLFALFLFMLATPVQICEVVNHDVAAVALTFFSTLSFFSFNEVARELEEPFMEADNDVPLTDLHDDFNEKILTIMRQDAWRTRWPHQNASESVWCEVTAEPLGASHRL